jgi:hypothetical protein
VKDNDNVDEDDTGCFMLTIWLMLGIIFIFLCLFKCDIDIKFDKIEKQIIELKDK